jgi:hypothetical protein
MLGDPGPAQLRAQFSGSNILQPASVVWSILKTCSVQLQPRLEQEAAQIGDSIAINIAVMSDCGLVNDGSLEIALNRKLQAAIPIHSGHVHWRLSTFTLSPGEYSIGVRYVPSSAGFVPESPQSLVLQLAPTSNQRRALWLVSGGLVFLWFAWRWLGGTMKRRRAEPMRVRKETKPQSLEVEPSTMPEFGWVGTIFDSHTGKPIGGAEVSVWVPSFAEVRPELHLLSGNDGTFRVSQHDFPTQSKLSVSAAGYVRAEWPMPKPGKLIVRLETRRRAVVRTFVHWAERAMLRPPAVPEPTPAEIRSLAEQRSLVEVAKWASNVERAAFGPDDTAPSDEATLAPPVHEGLGHKPTR